MIILNRNDGKMAIKDLAMLVMTIKILSEDVLHLKKKKVEIHEISNMFFSCIFKSANYCQKFNLFSI